MRGYTQISPTVGTQIPTFSLTAIAIGVSISAYLFPLNEQQKYWALVNREIRAMIYCE